jgi:hypothetical protein
VYNELLGLWAQIKSNQLEVVDLAVSYIKNVESSMVSNNAYFLALCCHDSLCIFVMQMQGDDSEAETFLEQLSNLASGRPGNILAAKALVGRVFWQTNNC